MERDRGVLKRLRGTPMPKWVYFAGKVLMVAFIAALETVMLLAVATPAVRPGAAVRREVADVRAGWSMLGITACTLCGIAFSSLARTGRSAPAVVTPVALVLQFISGVFFVFTDLPTWMQQVAAIFPLKWMCQGLRAVFLPESLRRAGARRLVRAGPGRAGAGPVVRDRPGAVPHDVPLDDQARRLNRRAPPDRYFALTVSVVLARSALYFVVGTSTRSFQVPLVNAREIV